MTCISINGLEDTSISLFLPKEQLLPSNVQLKADQKQFSDWSKKDHLDSFKIMQSVAGLWKKTNLTEQYLIYGKIDQNEFRWEMIPYEKCSYYVGRIVQQIKVLWRTIFGGVEISEKDYRIQTAYYKSLTNIDFQTVSSSQEVQKSNDSFCNNDIVTRQLVLTGEKVNVLFNYAPIGFGGEKLHFLVVPKSHRELFTEVTAEEYQESIELTKKLVNHFSSTRPNMENIYILNKTGVDAGQTVKHWHMHVIFCSNAAQDFLGKLTVFKNIIMGSSPMTKRDLEIKVESLRHELKQIYK